MDEDSKAASASGPPPPLWEDESILPDRDIVMTRLGQLLGSLLSLDCFLRRQPTDPIHESLCILVFRMIELVHSALGTASPIDTPVWKSPLPARVETF